MWTASHASSTSETWVAQEVMDRLSGAPSGSPERTQYRKFGDLAAVWGILHPLGVPSSAWTCPDSRST